jgi:hypothetical protein
VPKKVKITELNDYQPVTLTFVIMKFFERLVNTPTQTDPLLPLCTFVQGKRDFEEGRPSLHFATPYPVDGA